MTSIDPRHNRLSLRSEPSQTAFRFESKRIGIVPNGEETAEEAAVIEEPLEIRLNGQPIGVTTRTPDHDDELAVGFLAAKGIVCDADDVLRVETICFDTGDVVNVTLDPEIHCDVARLNRHVLSASSGVLSNGLEARGWSHLPVPIRAPRFTISETTLRQLPGRMRTAQRLFRQSGEPCAAAVFDQQGRMTVVREDIGRHNAVDKILGHGVFNDLLPFDHHVLLTAGRASYEVVQKALAGGFPIVVAADEPSSLALRFAREAGQTLVGLDNDQRLTFYTHPQRLVESTSRASAR